MRNGIERFGNVQGADVKLAMILSSFRWGSVQQKGVYGGAIKWQEGALSG